MPKPREIREKEVRMDVYGAIPGDSFSSDEDGNLIGRATVTCVGVFPYLLQDGTVFNELRLPEEVFAKDSLDSLRLIPITNDHPTEKVTPDNIDKLQVGVTGEDVCRADFCGEEGAYMYKTDGTQVTIPLKITRRDAIDAVMAGKRALSCGYACDLEMASGTWGGVHYDAIQRNIRYNHVAIVDRGRAGDTAVIKMDNAFVPTYMEVVDSAPIKEDKKEVLDKEANMPKSLVLDSTTYEVDEKVADAFAAMTAKCDTLEGQLIAKDTQIESLQKQMSGMIKADELSVQVREYQAVKETANKFSVSLDEDMSIMDMKKAIVKVAIPALADSIDQKSDDFINGVFSSCDSLTPVKNENTDENDVDDDIDEESVNSDNSDSDDACGGKKKKKKKDEETDAGQSIYDRLCKKSKKC